MSRATRAWICAVFAVLNVAWALPAGAAQVRPAEVPAVAPPDPIQSAGKSARARWDKLTPEQKQELAKRFDRWKNLQPDEREQLKRRAERLSREVVELEASLGSEERAALDRLAPGERRRVLQDLVADRARLMASRVRARMTPEDRRALEVATPEERVRLLKTYRERELARMPDRLQELGVKLGLSPKELENVQRGNGRSQRAAIAQIVRRRAQAQVEDGSLPSSLTPERWEQIAALGDQAFLRAMHRIRLRHPEFGIPKNRWEGRMRRRERVARRLEAIGLPELRDRAEAPRGRGIRQSHRTVIQRRRRVEDMIARQLPLSDDLTARLRALPDDSFFSAYRHAIQVLRDGSDVDASFDRWFKKLDRRRIRQEGGSAKAPGPQRDRR